MSVCVCECNILTPQLQYIERLACHFYVVFYVNMWCNSFLYVLHGINFGFNIHTKTHNKGKNRICTWVFSLIYRSCMYFWQISIQRMVHSNIFFFFFSLFNFTYHFYFYGLSSSFRMFFYWLNVIDISIFKFDHHFTKFTCNYC